MGHPRLILALGLWACAPRVTGPPLGPHEKNEAPLAVPYPPPAARPEELPDPPSETAVWVDGSYNWTGTRYVWSEGGWFEPEPGGYYAPPTLVRRRNGDLLYYPGHWHLDTGSADR